MAGKAITAKGTPVGDPVRLLLQIMKKREENEEKDSRFFLIWVHHTAEILKNPEKDVTNL